MAGFNEGVLNGLPTVVGQKLNSRINFGLGLMATKSTDNLFLTGTLTVDSATFSGVSGVATLSSVGTNKDVVITPTGTGALNVTTGRIYSSSNLILSSNATNNPIILQTPTGGAILTIQQSNGVLSGAPGATFFTSLGSSSNPGIRLNNIQIFDIGASGFEVVNDSNGLISFFVDPTRCKLANGGVFGWSSTSSAGAAYDTSLSRNAAGIVQIGTTSANALGTLNLAQINVSTTNGSATATQGLFENVYNAPAGFRIRANSGSWEIMFRTSPTKGWFEICDSAGTINQRWQDKAYVMKSDNMLIWTNDSYVAPGYSAADVSITRSSAAILQIGNGGTNASGSLLLTNLTSNGVIQMSAGSSSSAAIQFSANAGTGIYSLSSGLSIGLTCNGVVNSAFGPNSWNINSGVFLGFSSGSPAISSADVNFSRNAAGLVQVGTTAANTSGGIIASSYRTVSGFGIAQSTGGCMIVGNIIPGLTGFGGSGTDNTLDIGASGNRWKDLYLAGQGLFGDVRLNQSTRIIDTLSGNRIVIGGGQGCILGSNVSSASVDIGGSNDTFISRSSSGVLAVGNSGTVGNTGGTISVANIVFGSRILNTAYNTIDSNFRVGSIEIQPYALNNAFMAENIYFDGTNWRYRQTGYSGLFYFLTGEAQYRLAASGTAGAIAPSGVQLKVNVDGSFAVGPNVSNVGGNYTGFTFKVDPSGNATATGTIQGNKIQTGSTAAPGIFSTVIYSRETGGSANTWRGRIVAGGDNVAFLMGEYNSEAWLGAHNAALSAWQRLKINPDGTAELHLGNLNGGGVGTSPICVISNSTGATTFSGSVTAGSAGFKSQSGTWDGQIWSATGDTPLNISNTSATNWGLTINQSGGSHTFTKSGRFGVGFGQATGDAGVGAKFHVKSNITTIPTEIIQAVASQTSSLTEWQNSSGTVLAYVSASGIGTFQGVYSRYFQDFSGTGAYLEYVNATTGLKVNNRGCAASPAISVIGATSQTANLQEWQNSSGTVLSGVGGSGNFGIGVAPSSVPLNVVQPSDAEAFRVSQNAGARQIVLSTTGFLCSSTFTLGSLTWGTIATQEIYNGFASRVGLMVRGFTSQTGDLQQWQNVGGTVLTSVSAAGSLRVPDGSSSVPSFARSGNTNTGLFFKSDDSLWFTSNGTDVWGAAGGNVLGLSINVKLGFSGGQISAQAADVNFSRSAAGILQLGDSAANANGSLLLTNLTAAGIIGYGTGSGGTVTQLTSRTTGVTINKTVGSITLVSAAGSTTPQTFTVTNSTVGANDFPQVIQKSGANLYVIHVTAVAAGSFNITFWTTGGTTTEQPVFTFAVFKGSIT